MKEKVEYKFKVGDKVELIDDERSGVIKQVNEHDILPYLVFINGVGQWWYPESKLKLIPLTPKEMLKPGMVVEHANGKLAMVFENARNELSFTDSYGRCIKATVYDRNLICVDSERDALEWSISKLYGFCYNDYYLRNVSTVCRHLLWERPEAVEVEEMTLEQVCEELGREIKIVKG